ncbi:hypothetical protein KAT80_02130 [Candidatus Pacearchaeota archaeon]|nr:hypothetical protein [Candidatus Pacearchaeota archaeon]
MAEKDKIFSSSMKYRGIFSFKDFYKFCYDWLTEETDLDISEDKYSEKLIGNSKDIDVKWTGERKVTDYFKFEIKVEFQIRKLTEVEIEQGGAKVKTNQGEVKAKVTGTLIRDYDGKFEKDAFRKFLRSIYEKWVIKSRIDQFEEKLFGDCDEFLGQAKAYLALEGKR